MRNRSTLVMGGVLLCCTALSLTALGAEVVIVDDAVESTQKAREFKKLLIVAITDNQEVRRRFEDKFVSHLRGNGIDGVTSHSLVADLQQIENRDQIMDRIMEEKIDGAISVRVVPLEKGGDDTWHGAWAAGTQRDDNLRMLIEETLPVEPTKASRFGVEIAVWETENRYRVWAGRSDGHKLKELQEGAGGFIEYTVDALNDAGLLR